MKSINDYSGQELRWTHPHLLSAAYELHAGDEVLARLSFKGALSSQVRAETADGLWMFVRKGQRQVITVLPLDGHTELATIKHGMSGQATLQFPDGREYRWQCSSFWHDVWTWLNDEGTPLLHLKRGVDVQLEPAAHDLPELALLTTLGWYLYKQQEEERYCYAQCTLAHRSPSPARLLAVSGFLRPIFLADQMQPRSHECSGPYIAFDHPDDLQWTLHPFRLDVIASQHQSARSILLGDLQPNVTRDGHPWRAVNPWNALRRG